MDALRMNNPLGDVFDTFMCWHREHCAWMEEIQKNNP
jgi:hypothetical protein